MIEPLKYKILIQRDASPTETTSGLYIPEQAQTKETMGTVLAVGKDADETLKVGDRVMFGYHDGVEMKPEHCDDLERCLLIADNQVRCIIGANVEK